MFHGINSKLKYQSEILSDHRSMYDSFIAFEFLARFNTIMVAFLGWKKLFFPQWCRGWHFRVKEKKRKRNRIYHKNSKVFFIIKVYNIWHFMIPTSIKYVHTRRQASQNGWARTRLSLLRYASKLYSSVVHF